ncbi:MAG: WD40/YVTN/BNR-like repeat-containing protein, partial [Blastocatellia bacterium]
MNFSARQIRLIVISLLGFVLVGLCLFAGVKLWQQRQSSLPVSTASGSERASVNASDQAHSLPTGRGTDSANDLERRSLIERLKEKREALAEGRYDKPNEALEFFRLKRLATGETEIPVEKYLEAYRQMELMPQHTFGNDSLLPSRKQTSKNAVLPSWTSLGPGNVGGRTRAIVINPTTPTTMYAAGVAGGVWKTTNGGGIWLPTADLMANLAVNSLAIDPTNPNTLYAGTGEGFFNGDAVRGAGIFKTIDGGANWAQLANTTSTDFYYVNDIVVSPNNANRIYAATRTGVWRSIDGGTNWTKVLNATSVGSTTVAITGGCLDLAIRTDRATDYIFASCGNFEQARIFRNTDAGAAGTWNQVHTEASAGRMSLAIAPSNQDIIYALSAELDGPFDDALHAVFRSTASGDAGTWEARVRNSDPNKLNASLLSFIIGAFATNCGLDTINFFGGQAWYDNVIAVDPTDPNRVWTGGIDVMRSDDGGANWGMAAHAYQ